MKEVKNSQPANNKSSLSFTLNLRVVIAILLAVIAGMLFIWKPWTASDGDKIISVSGTATIKAEPDLFLFYPVYEFKNSDTDVALKEATAKSDEVVKKLKEIGVTDGQIKTNVDSYGDFYYYDSKNKEATYTLRLTVEAAGREQAQKVLDYLVTTSPAGAITPQATFSDAKQDELEDQARDEATKDARSKAEQSAKNLGFKLGGVKSVDDSGFGGGIVPSIAEDSSMSRESTLTIQPGQEELNYSLTVTYFVR